MLVNEGVPIERNGAVLWLAGISDFAAEQQIREGIPKPDIDASLRGRPPGATAVLLSHQPKAIEIARGKPVRLILAAHTHGGQLGFRALGWSLAGVFLPYHMGLYRIGDQYMYVNTGTGYWVLPFRLGMSPEITLITLRRASGIATAMEGRDRQRNGERIVR
jgi:predicted MPP superfamily phosphohydrolase